MQGFWGEIETIMARVCVSGISKVSPPGEYFMVAPSLHSKSLSNNDMGDWGQMVKEWSRRRGPFSSHISLVNSMGIVFPPIPIILFLAPGTNDSLNGGSVIN